MQHAHVTKAICQKTFGFVPEIHTTFDQICGIFQGRGGSVGEKGGWERGRVGGWVASVNALKSNWS